MAAGELPERRETRLALIPREQFLDAIVDHFTLLEYSNRPYTQTVYFNNDDHDVPFGVSFKARRYVPDPSCPILSLDDNSYFLEIKRSHGDRRSKSRTSMTIEEAERFLNDSTDTPLHNLRPYMAVVYMRQHFVLHNCTAARLTLDTDVKYFYFLDGETIQVGHEDGYARLEIKESEDVAVTALAYDIARDLGAVPIISKKCKGFYSVSTFLEHRFGKPCFNELPGYEIEAKLEASSEESFRKAKDLFRTACNGFSLSDNYPFTNETHSIRRYYRKGEQILRVAFVDAGIKITEKGEAVVVEDPFGMNCILKRREAKGQVIPSNSPILDSAEILGSVDRSRKAFFVTNEQTGRFYHVSFDITTNSSSHICQIEVEYISRFNKYAKGQEADAEEHVIRDIAAITKAILLNDSSLKPTTLTKRDFALGVA